MKQIIFFTLQFLIVNLFSQVSVNIFSVDKFDTYIDIAFNIKNNSNRIKTITDPLPEGDFGTSLINIWTQS